jgi:hypothetical protein
MIWKCTAGAFDAALRRSVPSMTGAAVVTATVIGALYFLFFAANFSFQSRAVYAGGRSRCDHNNWDSALHAPP